MLVANLDRFRQLPNWSKLKSTYRKSLWMFMLSMIFLAIITVLVTARPNRQSLVTPEQKNRDIMLCLDVSPSMYQVDATLFEIFEKISKSLDGQRIGLTVFNEVGVSIFPLTDDYDLIAEQLTIGKSAFQATSIDPVTQTVSIPEFGTQEYEDYLFIKSGTTPFTEGSSLAGDGLASCVNRMGNNETKRSQSIILATDNEYNGKQIVDIIGAATYAKESGIRVYVLDPGQTIQGNLKDHQDLQSAAKMADGEYYLLDNTAAITEIINKISETEATYYASAPTLARSDFYTFPVIAITILLIFVFVVQWRFWL